MLLNENDKVSTVLEMQIKEVNKLIKDLQNE